MLPSEWRQPQQRQVITEYRHIRQEHMRSLKAVQFAEKQQNLAYSPEITRDMQHFRDKHALFLGVQRFREDYQAEKIRQEKEAQQRLEEQQRQVQQARLDRLQEQQRQEQQQAEQKKIRRPAPGRGFSR